MRVPAVYDGCGLTGNVLIDADYSQLELRLMCELSGDPVLVELFNSDTKDVFEDMASYFKSDGVTRTKAKHLCYGLIYGESILQSGRAEQLNQWSEFRNGLEEAGHGTAALGGGFGGVD